MFIVQRREYKFRAVTGGTTSRGRRLRGLTEDATVLGHVSDQKRVPPRAGARRARVRKRCCSTNTGAQRLLLHQHRVRRVLLHQHRRTSRPRLVSDAHRRVRKTTWHIYCCT
jgi:hypothetical protein